MNPDQPQPQSPATPQAKITSTRQPWWPWLIPAAAAIFAIALVATYVLKRGPVITVILTDSQGVEVGTLLRCRGVPVGEVETIALNDAFNQVEAHIRLTPENASLARAASRFWLVRPEVNVNEISGLETLAGARYLAVAPGDPGAPGNGPPQWRFIALDHAPPVEAIAPDGLKVQLTADQRGSIRPGTRIFYRQMPIGTVLSVGLASDSASVEILGYIQPAYVALIRENTRFWNVSGVGVDVGFGGLKLQVDSLQSVITGGIAMATPDDPAPAVSTGRRFVLHDKPDPDWLAWQPRIPIGAELLPAGAPRPNLLRVTVDQTTGTFISRSTQKRGWLLPTGRGLVGPASLFQANKDAVVELLGARLSLADLHIQTTGQLALVAIESNHNATQQPADSRNLPDTENRWPSDRTRAMQKPESCVVLCDAATPPIPIAAERLTRTEAGWRIDPSISIDPSFAGAAAVARTDGRIVGLIVFQNPSAALIADWPADGPADRPEKSPN